MVYQIPFHRDISASRLAELKSNYLNFLEAYEDVVPEDFSRPLGRDAEYIDKAVWGVFDNLEAIDDVISSFLTDWTVDRIGKVDLALLRLSIYEMLTLDDVPLGVSVNEAVALAKEYGSDASPSFVNGVLGSVSRAIKAQGRENVAAG